MEKGKIKMAKAEAAVKESSPSSSATQQHSTDVLHQRAKMPRCPMKMPLGASQQSLCWVTSFCTPTRSLKHQRWMLLRLLLECPTQRTLVLAVRYHQLISHIPSSLHIFYYALFFIFFSQSNFYFLRPKNQ